MPVSTTHAPLPTAATCASPLYVAQLHHVTHLQLLLGQEPGKPVWQQRLYVRHTLPSLRFCNIRCRYVAAAEPLLVPGVVGAKVVKCGKFSTCASVGSGAQHRLMCWGNKFGPGAGYPVIQPDITWPSPALLPLPGNKALKEGIDTFSIGSFTGDVSRPACYVLLTAFSRLAGCAVIADTASTSTLWCWGDIRFLRPNGYSGTIPFDTGTMTIPDTAGLDVKSGEMLHIPYLILFDPITPCLSLCPPVSVGATNACAVDIILGGLYCWGSNIFCQLGNDTSCKLSGSNAPQPTPVRSQLQLSQKFASVTVSDRHTCAITDSKALYCWGQNSNGFLGNSAAPLAVVPTPVLVTLNSVLFLLHSLSTQPNPSPLT